MSSISGLSDHTWFRLVLCFLILVLVFSMTVSINVCIPNGNNINIPSYALKVDDVVSVRERSKSLEVIANSLSMNRTQMDWLEFNLDTKVGKVIAAPERSQIPENIKEQVIVELYSK